MSLKQAIRIAKHGSRITPRLHGWLNQHPNGVRIEDDAVAKRVMDILGDTEGDRSGAFHPSQLYQCKRAQVFGYWGVEGQKRFNPTLQNLFNDGHFRHLRWQIMLLNAGILTDIEVGVSVPEYRLTGSMDGVNADEGWMFELKGTSQYSTVLSRGAMPAHVKQINAYLMASGLEQAVILYECKSSQQWREIEVHKDQTVVDELESILQELNHAIDTGELPEVLSDCKNQTGSTFNNCQYSGSCLGVRKPSDLVAILPPRRRSSYSWGDASGD